MISNSYSRSTVLLYLVCSCISARALNIDTSQPIIRSPPFDQQDGYFGFSVVLHQINTGASTMQQALSNTRIIISAPNGTAPGSTLSNLGLVFTCPVDPTAGGCEGLQGDSGDTDRRLFDTDGNAGREEKEGQFLGASMASSGDTFVVCAHRYLENVNLFGGVTGDADVPIGRCYFSDRDLRGFSAYEPCGSNSNTDFTLAETHCLAGGGVALPMIAGGQRAIAAGTPGAGIGLGVREDGTTFNFFAYEGGVARRDPLGSSIRREQNENNAWQGYTVAAGRIQFQDRDDILVSAPRSVYMGRVDIISNEPSLSVVSQTNLQGTQVGEYYGFSLLTADLTGDGFDELLVGAPMYFTAASTEAGRVFVYRNRGGTRGSLDLQPVILTGELEPYSRFGYAMASLGDTNGDGLDDVAISAPFGSGSGKVFIYLGSAGTTISTTPAQIIIGDRLSMTPPLIGLTGFGTSLASGVDVDGNSYNDLAVGSFESQQVYLLRARPVANVATSVVANPNIVDVDNQTCLSQQTGLQHACFNVTACATYNGRGVADNLDLTYMLTVERTNVERRLQQRLFFDIPGLPNTFIISQMVAAGVETCVDVPVYVMAEILDRFNGFLVELELETTNMFSSSSTGSDPPQDFTSFPVLAATGNSFIQVETFRDCNGDVCIPDLGVQFLNIVYSSITPGQTPTQLTAGLVSNFTIWLRVTNTRDDAFQATLTFTTPTTLDFVRIEPREAFAACSAQSIGTQDTQLLCTIGNPFPPDTTRDLGVLLRPTALLTGAEDPISLTFSLSSINPEMPASALDNNQETVTLETNALADISVDPGMIAPEQLVYSFFVSSDNVTNATQLGAPLRVSFAVRNAGPSDIPSTRLVIQWPLQNASDSRGNYYLYPIRIGGISTGGNVECDMTYINPEGLQLPPDDMETFQQESGGAGGATSGRRRRRRSVPPLAKIRRARQIFEVDQSEGNTQEPERMNITLSCGEGSSEELTCVPITCTFSQLPGRRGSAQVDITAYLDDRSFAGRFDFFTFVVAASVSIEENFIDQPQNDRPDSSTVIIPIIPPDVALTVPTPERESDSTEPWVIIVPIIAGMLFLLIVAGVLWGLGFFNRKKHQEIKKKREALQELTENTDDNNIVASTEQLDVKS